MGEIAGIALVKLVLTLVYLVATAGGGMYCVVFPAFLLIRPFSKALYLRLIRLYIGAGIALRLMCGCEGRDGRILAAVSPLSLTNRGRSPAQAPGGSRRS